MTPSALLSPLLRGACARRSVRSVGQPPFKTDSLSHRPFHSQRAGRTDARGFQSLAAQSPFSSLAARSASGDDLRACRRKRRDARTHGAFHRLARPLSSAAPAQGPWYDPHDEWSNLHDYEAADSWIGQKPRYNRQSRLSAEALSSLDLELGDASRWDIEDPLSQDWDIEDDEASTSSGRSNSNGNADSDNSSTHVASSDAPSLQSQTQAQTQAPAQTQTHRSNAGAPEPADEQNLPRQYQLPRNHRTNRMLLSHFEPSHQPATDVLADLQLWLECEAQQEDIQKYMQALESARQRKDYGSLTLVQRHVLRWFEPLVQEFTALQQQYISKSTDGAPSAKSMHIVGPLLSVLSPEKLAVIAANQSILYLLLKSGGPEGRDGVPFVALVKRLGEAVEEEVLIHRALYQRFRKEIQEQQRVEREDDSSITDFYNQPETIIKTATSITSNASPHDNNDPSESNETNTGGKGIKSENWLYAASHLKRYLEELSQNEPTMKKRRIIRYALRRARQVLENEQAWSEAELIQLGTVMFQALLSHATIPVGDSDEMAFDYYSRRRFGKSWSQSFVSLHEQLYQAAVVDEIGSLNAVTARQKPMIVPAKPWTSSTDGGYLWLKTDLMRCHGSNVQKEALQHADLQTVLDGLNSLGRVPWKINHDVLEVAQQCRANDIALGDIPTRTDHVLPEMPVPPEKPSAKLEKDSPVLKEYYKQRKAYKEAFHKYKRMRQKNMVSVHVA
jgi:DNA-directed RNA polymerase